MHSVDNPQIVEKLRLLKLPRTIKGSSIWNKVSIIVWCKCFSIFYRTVAGKKGVCVGGVFYTILNLTRYNAQLFRVLTG